MKTFSKLLLALAALAIAATPALAIEHEFSGRFQSMFVTNNFISQMSPDEKVIPTNESSDNNYFDQRLRLGYQAKAKDVKLVTKFEIDYSYWGNSSFVAARNSGGAIGADSVNIETKNIYLDWTVPSYNLNTKIGMQGYGDYFSGILFGADMAGVLVKHSYENASASLGLFRWEDSMDNDVLGDSTQDLLALTGDYTINKDLKVGGAYYYIQDKTDGADAKVSTLGVTAVAFLGDVTVNAFALKQFGDFDANTDAKGFAAKLGARAALGSGTLRGDVLFVDGGKNQLYDDYWNSGYYDSELMILARDKNATSLDTGLIYDVNNAGEGLTLVSIGYDHTFSSTLSGSVNLGYGEVSDNQTNDDDDLGTEINAELNKQVTENLTIGGRTAYVFLGDYYDNDADDLYAFQLLVAYSF